MSREFWINLPVKEVQRSRAFFEAIGFVFDEARSNPSMACMVMGEKGTVVMLFPEPAFEGFAQARAADTGAGAEVLFSVGADSRDEVDALARKVAAAGGTVYGPPHEVDGWMYGAGFLDPDGHRWSVLHMDFAKMPGAGGG